jgi:hypothetical protein
MGINSAASLVLLLRLVFSHVLADFALQPGSWVRERRDKHWFSTRLYIHGLVVAVLGYLLAGMWPSLWLPLVLFITHIMIDGLKAKRADTAGTLVLDQTAHAVVLVVCWWLLVRARPADFIQVMQGLFVNPRLWILAVSYALVLWPAGVLIGKLTEPFQGQLDHISSRESKGFMSLKNAGLWVGRLERILILTFVLLGRFEAIGFLIAAKSIFRFGDVHSPGNRKEAEYILIGTLLSFVIAIGIGLLVRGLLNWTASQSGPGAA